MASSPAVNREHLLRLSDGIEGLEEREDRRGPLDWQARGKRAYLQGIYRAISRWSSICTPSLPVFLFAETYHRVADEHLVRTKVARPAGKRGGARHANELS